MDSMIWSWHEYRDSDQMYHLSYYQCDGPYAFPAHRHHDQWELVYVSQGILHHRLGGLVHKQGAGSFFVVREADLHSLRGSAFSYFNLAFPVSLLLTVQGLLQEPVQEGLAALTRQSEPLYGQLQAAERPAFEASLHRLLGRYDPLFFLEFWCAVMGRLLQAPGAPLGGDQFLIESSGQLSETMPDWLAHALNNARESAAPPDLERFIAWCGKSHEHVARSVRRFLKRTPSELMGDLRLDRARNLLARTNRTVTQIAAASGFASLNYFHKQFRRKFACTPAEFRRSEPRPH